MDVVLLKDVERVGKEGAVVHVKPGFARNYLMPRGLALMATEKTLKAVEDQRQQLSRKTVRLKQQREALKQQLERLSLTLKLTLGEEGTAFGSVSAHDIVEALAQEGLSIEKAWIQLDAPIKALGIYEVPIRLHADVTATLKLWVVKA